MGITMNLRSAALIPATGSAGIPIYLGRWLGIWGTI